MKSLYVFFVLLFSITLISCQKGTGNNPVHITVFLTDHATPVFDSVFIDIQELEVKLEDDALPNGGWVSLSVRPGIYNILRFRNGIDTLFANGILPGNRLRKLRMTLGTQNSVMKDNQSFPLTIKDNEHEIIANINDSNFDIIAPDQVLFWIDFDAGRSIQFDNSGQGNSNGYLLKAHIKVFTKRKSGSLEGSVLPQDADPVVMATSQNDTATAIPENNGSFKIPGLNAGIYTILIDGHNGYKDTTLHNIIVRNNEATRLPVIMLRR